MPARMAEQKLFFEDVNEGDEAPVVTHELTRTDLVRYAGASGDFNPMHHDEVKAKEAGLPQERRQSFAAPARVINLMEALRRSLAQDKKRSAAARKGAAAAPARKRA